MKTIFLKIFQGMCYLLATLIILAAVLVSVARLATPLLNQHHKDFEIWASQLLQVPVTVGEVRADWRGYVPEFSISNVVTLDRETHKPAFEIKQIKLGFQLFLSLWRWQIVLQDIILSGAHLTVLQDASGKLSLKNLPVQQDQSFKSYELIDTLQWIFSQSYLALHDINVDFLPYNGEQKNLMLNTVAVSNKGDQHKIHANVVLNQEVSTEIKSQVDWQGDIDDFAHAKGRAYFHVEGLSLPQWLKYKTLSLSQLLSGWEIRRGIGGADVWLDWQNEELQEAQSIFQWYDLEFYSNYDQKIYSIPRLSGHLGWKKDGEKQIIAGDNVLIDFPEHFWPATTIYLKLAPTVKNPVISIAPVAKKKAKAAALPLEAKTQSVAIDNNAAWHMEELRIGYVDFQDILPIVLANSSWPLEWRKNLVTLDPAGDLRNLNLVWQGALTDCSRLSASGQVDALSFHPLQKIPGVKNLSAILEWNGMSGNVQLLSHEVSFTLRSLFAEPLIFDTLRAHLSFQQDKNGLWSFVTPDATIINADLKAKTFLQMTFPRQESPTIDLKGEFSLNQVSRVAHYLPVVIMDRDLVAWLKSAFSNGRLESGKAVVRGKLSDFPFEGLKPSDKETGIFEVSSELKDVDFHYAPQWPIIHQADGQLAFMGRQMRVFIDSAFILDVPIKQITAVIPYIGDDKPQILGVQGKIKTDLARALDFVHQSPLEEIFGKDMSALQLAGPMNLGLSLSVPLGKPSATKVLGEVQVSQGTLTLPKWKITLEQINGGFLFTDHDITAEKLLGTLWGVPSLLQLSTIPAGQGFPSYVQAKVTGKVDMSHLDTALDLSVTSFLTGATNYSVLLKLYNSSSLSNDVSISSNLQGVMVDLPAPFGKPSAQKRDFSLSFELLQTPQFSASLKYGDLVNARFTILTEKGFRSIDVDSPQLKGKIRFAYPFNMKQPIQAQLDRLAITSGNEKNISAMNPASVPPLVITAKQFMYENKNLGQLVLNTQPKMNGLTIQDFNLMAPDYDFKSHGDWTGSHKAQTSQIQGTIQSTNVRKFLERLGVHLSSVIVDKGQAAFDLQWAGPPYGFTLATMRGDFSFALEKGRIIHLNDSSNSKMDIGRMLSLFSLQTIPRRLSGDFSDLVEQGYSFDFIRGDFVLKQGNAFTQKEAVFDGPVARVTASGRIGLLKQDYNLTLSVSPYVTESLPIVAGAITLNPLVGAAAWVVNKMVLSKEVSKAITYNYTVTGPWTSPVWRSSTPANARKR